MKNNHRITIKNELPELLEAVCSHQDCEDWLKEAIWLAFYDQELGVIYSRAYWQSQLESIRVRKPIDKKYGDLNAEVINER